MAQYLVDQCAHVYIKLYIYVSVCVSVCTTQEDCGEGCSQGLPGVPGMAGAKGEKGDQGKPGATPLDSCDRVRLCERTLAEILSASLHDSVESESYAVNIIIVFFFFVLFLLR